MDGAFGFHSGRDGGDKNMIKALFNFLFQIPERRDVDVAIISSYRRHTGLPLFDLLRKEVQVLIFVDRYSVVALCYESICVVRV